MEINEEYLVAFFGKNADYYLHKWRAWQQGRRVSFNAAAFFAGIFWFVYRRMYLITGLILVGLILETQVEQWLVQRRELFPFAPSMQARTIVANLLMATLFSAFGNWIYLRYARYKIRRVLRRETSEEAILRELRRQGGTSWRLILVALTLLAGLLWLLTKYPPPAQ